MNTEGNNKNKRQKNECMKKQDEQEWVNKAMNSLEGIRSAEPNAFLYTKIRDRVASSNSQVLFRRIIPFSRVIVAAASLALLLLLNCLTLYRQDRKRMHETPMQQVASYYQLTNDNLSGL